MLVAFGLLSVPREQHQYDIRDIRHENGRRVEHQSATQHLHQVTQCESLCEIAVVDHQVDDASHEVEHIDHQQVADGGCQWG